jgi:multiple sugar transport system permease protein
MDGARRKRPIGVSVLSVLLLLSALALLVRTLSLHPGGAAGLGRLLVVLVLAMIAIGLWKLKDAARLFLFFLLVVDALGNLTALVLYALPQHHPRLAGELAIELCVAAGAIWYLQKREVKHAFAGLSAWPRTLQMLVILLFTVALAFPFFWMAIATFKQNIDLYAMENNPFLFNLPPTLDHLRFLFAQSDFQLVVLLVEFCVSAFLGWSLWKFRPKRLWLFLLLVLAVAESLFAFHYSDYWPALFLVFHAGILISLVMHVWTGSEPARFFALSFLVLDWLAATIALFVYALHQSGFVRWLGNTTLVGVIVVAITLMLALPAAYALARLTGRWGERLGIAIFLTYLVPPTLLFIPLSRVVALLGLQDTIWSLVLVYPSVTVPFSIWLLMGFFKSIPKELEDAAMVDGLTRFGAFIKMVVPISLSGILTVVIFTFTLVTQEFIYALTFVSPESQQMVGVGVPIFLVRGDVYYWGALMAACLIASIPIAFLYNLFLDRFIAGFTVGAVKG